MSLVETSRDGRGVVTVTLADEANRNALSRRLLAELWPGCSTTPTPTRRCGWLC